MKKRIIFLLTLIYIAVLSACGSQTTQTPPQLATLTQAPVQPTQPPAPTNTSIPTNIIPSISTTAPVTNASIASVSFANDVLPIFNNSCTECHGIRQIKVGLNLTTYDSLMAGSFNGSVVTPGNAADSFLVKQIVEGEMPKRGPKLTAEQIQKITDWVNAGALNN